MFIALIQRIALLQISRMLAFTGNLGRQVIEEMYPSFETLVSADRPEELASSTVSQTVAYSGEPQALQGVDSSALLALATESGGCVELSVSVGDTLITGMPMLRVYSGNGLVKDETWKEAFETGADRTFN